MGIDEKKSKKKKRDKKKKEHKKEKKKKRERKDENEPEAKKQRKTDSDPAVVDPTRFSKANPRPFVENTQPDATKDCCVTIALFYQYVEPLWNDQAYHEVLSKIKALAQENQVTGRMRIAKEGVNCTLTSRGADAMRSFCQGLRDYQDVFYQTEFKLTHGLPQDQLFGDLKIMPVQELVHYGLEGTKAPPGTVGGVHLEPEAYHAKLHEPDTVVIDVRNHYEATIGHFDPQDGAKYLDPGMRKSTEFPVWLENEKEKLRDKQVLMFCTGGIRCERASALLKYKMEEDAETAGLNIKGVYQLQGGIDNYLRKFPEGGCWKGKNYTFDKRFAHTAVKQDTETPMSECQSCSKPWDKYRGKRRCSTCGVPSLICKTCLDANPKLSIQCDMCKQQTVKSKRELRDKEASELEAYEKKQQSKGLLHPRQSENTVPNPENITRLFLRNMCRKTMSEEALLEFIPSATHVVWRNDRKSGSFLGQGWVEVASPLDAATAVGKSGQYVCGRPVYASFDKPNGKDAWPPSSSKL